MAGNVLLSNRALAQEAVDIFPKQTPYLLPEYFQEPTTKAKAGRSYFPTLTPPFFNRATYRYTVGRNAWALEQLLVFANVTATIRTNVIQLSQESGGGLWVHSPQWPTGEFCSLLDGIGQPVRHVVLPCNALEHKAPMKAFLKKYPDASVWISPGQYGPFGSCGLDLSDCSMGYRVDGIFPMDGQQDAPMPPWANEFDFCTLYADLPENAGPVSEVIFCHRPTQTLIATDAVVFVPSGPKSPGLFGTYFDESDPSTMGNADFWPKSVLQAVFLPLRTDQDGRYPGYEALKDRLVRAPILRSFVDARAPNQVREWVRRVGADFEFNRILTSHFASPIAASPQNFVDAFAYLNENANLGKLPNIACQDWALLGGLNQVIGQNKLGAPVVFDFSKGCQ